MSKQSYIEKGFIEVCKNRCPEQSEKLISDMNNRLAVLRKETENESKAMKFHALQECISVFRKSF
mgnify:CR=1 FL=1